ncbi:MAG: hypothetical protein PHV18_12085 [Lachnospiraceae bacterium]|nr:hypothetical protein [Lachnospiraceae bacterium]
MKRCLNCMEEYEEEQAECPFCGWFKAEKKDEALEPGSILQGRYIVGTVRRRNCADILYIGWDALFSRKVFIEEYFPKSRTYRLHGETLERFKADDPDVTEGLNRFIESGQMLISLDETAGLLPVFAVISENQTAYMILEYPGDRTLRDVLESRAPMTIDEAEKLLMNLSRPLLAAHRNEIYHGQLNLECCYAVPQGKYKIGDFNDTGVITQDTGDDHYEAPCPDADIFELAHIVGAALTGVKLWESRSVDDNLEKLSNTIPDYVIDALSHATSENPDVWPSSLRRFVDEFMDEATIELPSGRVFDEEEQPRKNHVIWKKIFS